ncbi:hypothetical protein [Phenylobacterium sp.]|uniref:hypothetical protein n=1 Tax=Phenylobacterium sp. TaxID=1871053 RepID=UPI0035AE748A
MLKVALGGLAIALGVLAAPAAAAPPTTHLVVFNRPGPNFARAADLRDAALAHQALYRRLAAEGKIVAGGRMEGEPALGLSVFAPDIDPQEMRRLLTEDLAVKAGLVAIEFRDWQLQMGSLTASDADRDG